MPKPLTTTLSRDLSVLTQRRLFWWALAFWAFICTFIFYYHLEDFLAIQPSLRAKNFRYGVTDLVIIPYINVMALMALVFFIGLCARLFYHEHFTPFGDWLRSTQPPASQLVLAKISYILTLSTVITALLALPVLAGRFFFTYDFMRVMFTLLAQFVLLFSAGMLTMVFSQRLRYSILVVLTAGLVIGVAELLARLLVEPEWLAAVATFFSPFAHVNRIATGIVTLSDGVFFILLWLILSAIAVRQFNNNYLQSL